jgi:multiple sugar transport system ATP-binding protein
VSGDFTPVTERVAGMLPLERAPALSVGLLGVSKYYDDVAAVKELTLEARAGEFLVLLGPSGCGKSTVLRLVAGLEDPSAGAVRIGDQVVNDVDPKDRDVAMVFQSYALYPHLSVARNIEFPLRSRQVPTTERKRLVEEVAKSLHLEDLLGRKPAQLSGGQRQRVALARAIVRRPKAFLMDEPLSNLDAQLRVEMRAELVELHVRLGITILYVTHDQVEAMTMGDRVAILDHGELQQVDTPAAVHDRPANSFVAGFIGNPPMNIVRGKLGTDDNGLYVLVPGGRLPLPPPFASAARRLGLEELVLGFRPEDVRVVGTESADGTQSATRDVPGTLEAVVSLVELVGHEQHVACRLRGGELLWVRMGTDSVPLRTGQHVTLEPNENIHLFHPVTSARIDV